MRVELDFEDLGLHVGDARFSWSHWTMVSTRNISAGPSGSNRAW